MPVVDVSGTINGSGTASAAAAMTFGPSAGASGSGTASSGSTLGVELSETLEGSSVVTGTPEHIYIFSGTAKGSGELIDDTLGMLAGTVVGSATVLAGPLIRAINVSGYIQGSSQIVISAPNPIYGVAIVTAFMEVIHVPPPAICTYPPTRSLRWGQNLEKTDLCISLTDGLCNPFGPVCIDYTLYRVVQGCALKQVGCAHQRPATCKVGTYYATGCAGEGGQPGQWVIRWRYQRTYADPIIETDMCYEVLDAVLGPLPGDTTDRNCKYGWD